MRRDDPTPSLVDLICEVCGKAFSLERSRVWNGRGATCSRACANIHRKRFTVVPQCQNCGTELSSVYAKATHCKPCAARIRADKHWAAQPIAVCPMCEGAFHPTSRNGKYCSQECAAKRFGESPTVPNPGGYCLCGCGRITPIAEKTHRKNGYVAGEHIPYLRGHSGRLDQEHRYLIEDRGFETPCWIWQGPLFRGYGQAHGTKAHRMMFRLHGGTIPNGMHLHHKCEVPSCVNPDHMAPMNPNEHMRLHKRKGA
jgi:hypothetical protein